MAQQPKDKVQVGVKTTTVIKIVVIVVLMLIGLGLLFSGCGLVGCLTCGGLALDHAVREAEKPAKETQVTEAVQKAQKAERAQTAKYDKRETLRQSVRRTDERLQAISEELGTLRTEFDKLVASGEYEKAERIKQKQLALNAETERLTERRKQLQGKIQCQEEEVKRLQEEQAKAAEIETFIKRMKELKKEAEELLPAVTELYSRFSRSKLECDLAMKHFILLYKMGAYDEAETAATELKYSFAKLWSYLEEVDMFARKLRRKIPGNIPDGAPQEDIDACEKLNKTLGGLSEVYESEHTSASKIPKLIEIGLRIIPLDKELARVRREMGFRQEQIKGSEVVWDKKWRALSKREVSLCREINALQGQIKQLIGDL